MFQKSDMAFSFVGARRHLLSDECFQTLETEYKAAKELGVTAFVDSLLKSLPEARLDLSHGVGPQTYLTFYVFIPGKRQQPSLLSPEMREDPFFDAHPTLLDDFENCSMCNGRTLFAMHVLPEGEVRDDEASMMKLMMTGPFRRISKMLTTGKAHKEKCHQQMRYVATTTAQRLIFEGSATKEQAQQALTAAGIDEKLRDKPSFPQMLAAINFVGIGRRGAMLVY